MVQDVIIIVDVFQFMLGQVQDFSFDMLVVSVCELVVKFFVVFVVEQFEVLDKIDYDVYWKIVFCFEIIVKVGDVLVQFFYLGIYFCNFVKISIVEDGKVCEIIYDVCFFDMFVDSLVK